MITLTKINALLPTFIDSFDAYRSFLTRAGLMVRSVTQRPADGMYIIEIDPPPVGLDAESMIHRHLEYQTYPALVVYNPGLPLPAPQPVPQPLPQPLPPKWRATGGYGVRAAPNQGAQRLGTLTFGEIVTQTDITVTPDDKGFLWVKHAGDSF